MERRRTLTERERRQVLRQMVFPDESSYQSFYYGPERLAHLLESSDDEDHYYSETEYAPNCDELADNSISHNVKNVTIWTPILECFLFIFKLIK